MPPSQCNSFVESTDSWMEGERSPALQAHLHGCTSCRSLITDLETIRSIAQEFSEPEAPPRVWAAIQAQIEPAEAASSWRRWFTLGWSRPVLATATLALLIAGAFVLGRDMRNANNDARWTAGTVAATQPIQTNLGNFELHAVSALPDNPVINASFHKNLQVVDNYIKLCEKSVREDPQNELARDYLYGAYQQKADLLADMSEHGENQQ